MNHYFYVIVSVRNNDVVVSNPYKWNSSVAVLCDKAREFSLDNNDVFVSLYRCYCDTPTMTRLLYRFYNGLLVRC